MDDFVINALLAGLGLAVVAGPLGCVVVWRRMAYFGDALAHSALLGIAMALFLDIMPLVGVTVVGVILSTLLYWLEQHRELATDTLLGILSHSSLALGLIVFSILQASGSSADLQSFLFGDILAVTESELIWIYSGALTIVFLFSRIWRQLLSISVHEELARTDGVRVSVVRFVFILMLALVIAVAIKVVGILLITALLIIPAASARIFSRTPIQMILLSVVFAMLAVVFGLEASLYWDLPTGPAIVVVAATGFIVARSLRFQ